MRARAPLRISFGGGGSDVSPYCDEFGGAVLSAAIDRYAYASVRAGGDAIRVCSIDYDVSVTYDIDEQFVYDGQLDLAKAVIDEFRTNHGLTGGLEIHLHNDAPPGSGLGSSSGITIALITALAAHTGVSMDTYALAELAYRIERVDVGIVGGRQDQYACAFGGVNYIEFEPNGGRTVVTPLRISKDTLYELEYSLVFAHVGGSHAGAGILDRQVAAIREQSADALAATHKVKELAAAMKRELVLGNLATIGGLLDEAWESKRRMAEGISNERLDALYAAAKDAGALGGKISGAGGGGFMFFITDPERRFAVQEAVAAHGGELVMLSFVAEGATSWKS
ncbi:MAG: GHMP kinase [Coriobacteriia bacterium]|nr:GHMP kinase [Coriobacteriia bacterium]